MSEESKVNYESIVSQHLEDMNKIFDNIQYTECGRVIAVNQDIVQAIGLTDAFLHEIVIFENILDLKSLPTRNEYGIIVSIDEHVVTIMCLHEYKNICAINTIVKRTNNLWRVMVSENMIGNIFDGFGVPISPIALIGSKYENIYPTPPTMQEMGLITKQLITGVAIIDIFTPIGYGQRQAIIGDAGTGKTTMLLSIMQSVRMQNQTLCIYVSIGQSITNIKYIEFKLQSIGATSYILIQAAAGSTSIEKYMAPFVAMTIAEYFKNMKYDVIVFIDDMNVHATAYQDITVRTKQPVGKEGYSADIFTQQAAILSMGHVSEQGGSITIFPIVNTMNEDIADYLVTNIISITDGQIMLSRKLAQSHIFPAINIQKSVSRIGRGIQNEYFRNLCLQVVNIMIRYNNLLELSLFGSAALTTESKELMELGSQINEFLRYEQSTHSLLMQISSLHILLNDRNLNIENLSKIVDMYANLNPESFESLQTVLKQYREQI